MKPLLIKIYRYSDPKVWHVGVLLTRPADDRPCAYWSVELGAPLATTEAATAQV